VFFLPLPALRLPCDKEDGDATAPVFIAVESFGFTLHLTSRFPPFQRRHLPQRALPAAICSPQSHVHGSPELVSLLATDLLFFFFFFLFGFSII
jgi:hypothetical protein